MSGAERDRDIEWLMHRAPSALGERGTFNAVINIAQQGSIGPSGVPNVDLYSDEQLGWGETPDGERRHSVGEIARARRLQGAWARLPKATQDRLTVRYATRSEWPAGVQGHFGQLAGLALYLAPNPSKVIKACSNSSTTTAKALIVGTLRRAEKANLKAHEEWRQALRAQYRAWAEAWAQAR